MVDPVLRSEHDGHVELTDRELAYISRAILTHRIECPWDETSLACELDARLKRLGAGPSERVHSAGRPSATTRRAGLSPVDP